MQHASPATPTDPVLAPVARTERIVHLDILRGIALLGVLVANVWLWFSGTVYLFETVDEQLRSFTADTVSFLVVELLISGKAITTFSFLFGLGFAVQMMRAEERGRSVGKFFSKRMAILLAIGAVHAIIFWYGDILATYALLGFALLLFRKASNRTLLIWAIVFSAAVPLILASVPLVFDVGPGSGDATEESSDLPAAAETDMMGGMVTEEPSNLEDQSATADESGPAEESAPAGDADETAGDADDFDALQLSRFASGEFSALLAGNLAMLKRMYISPRGIRKLWLLGIFLIGFYAGRRRIFSDPQSHLPFLKKVAIYGLAIGVAWTTGRTVFYYMVPPHMFEENPLLGLADAAIGVFATIPFALGYIALATILIDRAAWRRILMPFAPVGRMALTNYLGQTLVCMVIFYGFGLLGNLAHTLNLVIACAIFAVQMLLSAWWLKRFRFGPMEWLWRSAAYGKWQPMRIAAPVQELAVSEG